MRRRACAVALVLAVVVAAPSVAGYTVDCNHEYTDCETELRNLSNEDDEVQSGVERPTFPPLPDPTTTTSRTQPTTAVKQITREIKTTTKAPETTTMEEVAETTEGSKAQPRLLNLNVDDLQNFANALHNQSVHQSDQKKITDLSDVTIDDDDEPPKLIEHDHNKHDKTISDKFYTNLQAPFRPLLNIDTSEEIDTSTCKEDGIAFKIGDRIERSCDELCECSPGGTFDCTPRCKHPYIRRGRRLNDPLCFESPVDECCSIVACATGNTEVKVAKVEVCRHGNDTYPVGTKWTIGCEQKCSCEPNSVVSCKPRCNPLPPSDKCINVQDPNDECCEVQVCDVSQDAHEEPENATSSTTTTTTTTTPITTSSSSSTTEKYTNIETNTDSVRVRSTNRPLVLAEPIGSVKVLQNNSVQVNLMQLNFSEDPIHLLLSSDGGKNFEDVQLKYNNLILNLPGGKDYILKTKETGTKFNFTITAMDDKKEEKEKANITEEIGCHQDGQFYSVGEEFHIGCTHLCECTGAETKECVELVCPSHVGLELMSKGCVRWAPSPPPQPPNCCPRSARCLSDGTCHFKGIAIPNWSEVPIALTGCEQRCFCENGELDCQEACTPLPPVPPQTLRCPPGHRPAPANISDEDCCKEWGCIANAAKDTDDFSYKTYTLKDSEPSFVEYVTPLPVAPLMPTTLPNTLLPTQPLTADTAEFYKHLQPVKSYPKVVKPHLPTSIVSEDQKYSIVTPSFKPHNNITMFNSDSPETIESGYNLSTQKYHWAKPLRPVRPLPVLRDPMRMEYGSPVYTNLHTISYNESLRIPTHPNSYTQHKGEIITPDSIKPIASGQTKPNLLNSLLRKPYKESLSKVPISNVNNLNYFLPSYHPRPLIKIPVHVYNDMPSVNHAEMFAVANKNQSFAPTGHGPIKYDHRDDAHATRGKHLTILRSKDLNSIKLSHNDAMKEQNSGKLRIKISNPYETVLLRPVNAGTSSASNMKSQTHNSVLDFEQLVSQMEVESEVTRNLGRSADKAQAAATTPDKPHHPHQPSFLPTIPPEIHFPQDELPDYDQNNLHRPVNSLEPSLPPGLTVPPNYGEENKKLSVISLQADSPTSVKMLFGLPPVLVGLRGSVDLRYTDKLDEDISQWYSQVFAPADEVLTTPRLEFRLTGLKPSTTYKIRGKLFLHNLPVEPESEVYSVRTMDLPTVVPLEEKRREIDSRLTIVDVNDTAAHVSWRHFTEDELRFIDGIQVRYRPVGTPIYSMTELLHHSRSLAELHDLRPGTRYEASLVLVPPPRATTELHDPGRIEFTTHPYVDPYNWTAIIEARVVGSDAAELTWRGVPSPAERWVRVYRAAHACGASRREHDAFRLAARDLPPTIMLSGLQSNTRCRVWLELFLTNGKVKTSNVIEINTKPQDAPEDIDNEIEASSIAGAADSRGGGRGDYYGALVVVGVVAALGAMTSLLLLLVLVRRHRPRSVPITPVPSAPRESSLPPYDNPAYKLELQQETMDL